MSKIKSIQKLDMVSYTYNSDTQEAVVEDHKFKLSLGYITNPVSKKQRHKHKKLLT
jgi:hypothetical protein